MAELVTCRVHPGRHFETHRCRDARSDSAFARLCEWLEDKISTKGRSSWKIYCRGCSNVYIPTGPDNLCTYCGGGEYTAVHPMRGIK